MVISGFRPSHIISATTFSPASLILVRRLSQLVSAEVEGRADLEEEATAFDGNDCGLAFDEDEKDPGPAIIIVSISYALTPVAISTREVLSMSAAVNLSSILVGNIGNICEGVYGRQDYIRESSNGWEVYDCQVGHCLCARPL
jgi:hypothetical protein